ncbi:hypothetical protein F5884DRAFT_767060 [Xylogone sp. PMI_703]|nr:hypothetical protein F5884DRAFT_767060 [Xylogone sp. PMI_703]
MSSSSTNDPMHPTQILKYGAALKAFTSSPSTFRIIKSIPEVSSNSDRKTDALYVLDSSFNPPTLAHLRIAASALLHDSQCTSRNKRLLLLLATQNADKAPKPASFDQRLTMMDIFANDLLKTLKQPQTAANDTSSSEPPSQDPPPEVGIDIGLTTLPYFTQKATAIATSGLYPVSTPQVHLTGYDTLIRILNPKYYPPSHTLEILVPFLEEHRLRVTYRADDDWGSREEQDGFLKGILEGSLEDIGGKKEWVEKRRIELVEGMREVISSTRVREAAKSGDEEILGKLVSKGVVEWILKEGLYRE